jgi:tetratricopeptide (TPR) repeat protein
LPCSGRWFFAAVCRLFEERCKKLSVLCKKYAVNEADNAYNSEDWVQASNSYREVIETIPNDAYAWFRMGNALTQLGQYAQAVVAYETSLAADNGQFKAWFNLSTTHLLNAKVVTLNALRSIGMNDPSRKQVERRLDILTALLN